MTYELVFDPSGNFYEGKGTTGWIYAKNGVVSKAGQVSAKDYKSQMEYWQEVLALIEAAAWHAYKNKSKLTVICEDYRLYASASNAQINSNLETPQLIGAIKFFCFKNEITPVMQMAAEVKTRWSPEVMERTGKIVRKGRYFYTPEGVKLEHHSIDAYKHWLHYRTFKVNPEKQREKKRGKDNEY